MEITKGEGHKIVEKERPERERKSKEEEKKNWKGKKSLSRNIEDANIYTKREVENKINPRNYQKNKKTDKGGGVKKKKKETEGKQENKKKQKG